MDAKRLAFFNLTQEDFAKIWLYQDNKCAVCGHVLGAKPNMDHDHKTGLVRGILCHRCNRALGLFSDSILRLIQALEYLKNPPAVTALGGARFGSTGRITKKRRAEGAKGRRQPSGSALPRATQEGAA